MTRNTPPIISVIVPVYNVEAYVGECLQSILDQTFSNFEIIVIDDKSTDASLAIVQKYAAKDNRIKILEHDVNQGQGLTRNTGVSIASGKYITFIDSDDYFYTLDALQIMVDTMDQTDACVIQYPILRLLPNGDFHDADYNPKKKVYHAREAYHGLHHPDKYIQGYACSKVYKTSLFEHDSVIFPSGTMEDSVFVARVLSIVRKVVVIDQHLYLYRIRKGSTTQKNYSRKEVLAFFKNTFTLMDFVVHQGRKHHANNYYYAFRFYINTYIFQLHNTLSSLKPTPQETINLLESIKGASSSESNRLLDKLINHDDDGSNWHYSSINLISKAYRNGLPINKDLADYIYNMHPVPSKKLRFSYQIYSRLLLNWATSPLAVIYREAFITPKRLKVSKETHKALVTANPLSNNMKLQETAQS